MRMNITIEGKMQDMSKDSIARTKRCLQVLKDIGFDIKCDFTEESPEYVYYVALPARDLVAIEN